MSSLRFSLKCVRLYHSQAIGKEMYLVDKLKFHMLNAEPTNVVGKDNILPSPFVSDRLAVMGICRCRNSQNLLRIEIKKLS
jgi:hypothetical protein